MLMYATMEYIQRHFNFAVTRSEKLSSKNENQSQTPEGYMPWSQGAEVLGVGRGSFYNLVDTGQIRELKEQLTEKAPLPSDLQWPPPEKL